ncbi:hypothetical protein ACLB2K_055203 [Fragaria x ananassa]
MPQKLNLLIELSATVASQRLPLRPRGEVRDSLWNTWIRGHSTDAVNHKNGHYVPFGGPEDPELEKFDKPLPFCGCGIGWFSLLLGFVFPVMWYYAAFLYFWKYYDKDPRERSGLGASAVAALAPPWYGYMGLGIAWTEQFSIFKLSRNERI